MVERQCVSFLLIEAAFSDESMDFIEFLVQCGQGYHSLTA